MTSNKPRTVNVDIGQGQTLFIESWNPGRGYRRFNMPRLSARDEEVLITILEDCFGAKRIMLDENDK